MSENRALDIVCDDLPEIIFAYRGVRLIQKADRYELQENGQLLAVAKGSVVAERLFLYRALALATAEVEQTAPQRAAFTPQGKQVFFSAPQEPAKPPEDKLPKKKRDVAPFQKPTVEDIAAYCQERENGLDAGAIYDHYEANGWRVGRTKMKDWKAAVRTWERKRWEDQPSRTARPSRVELTNPENSSIDCAGFEEEIRKFRPVFKKQEGDDCG